VNNVHLTTGFVKSGFVKFGFIAACVAILCMPTAATAQQVDLRRMVTVEGEAEAFVIPDKASLELGVETEGRDADDVKKDNDKVMRKLISELKKIGIDPLDLQTSMVSDAQHVTCNSKRSNEARRSHGS